MAEKRRPGFNIPLNFYDGPEVDSTVVAVTKRLRFEILRRDNHQCRYCGGGFVDASNMVRTLADDEKIRVENPRQSEDSNLRAGGDQGVWYIAEPGFYKVVGQRNVNLIKDRKIRDAVARFQHWVFHDVIPAMVRSGQADERCLAGTTWSWDDVAAEIRQRYGLDYKPSEITAGMRGPHNHVLWPCPTVLELVDFSHVAGGV